MARRVTKEQAKVMATAAAGAHAVNVAGSNPNDPVYPVEVYLENCKQMFGKQRYVLVGALAGVDVPEEGISKSHMTALIDTFLAKPLS